ncbi:MAG: hypothetical protein J0M02_03865 [Planctomycetes bacterium]|nr:hypothetical protein [Planctomycetota bacterium]
MARRTIHIDGDASGLKSAASTATQTLRAELDAQKRLVAEAKAAQQAMSKEATAAEKAAAKAAVQAAREGLDAKKKAYAEATAAAKAASAAIREAERDQARTMAEMAQRARTDTKRTQREAQQRQEFGRPAGGDGGADDGVSAALGAASKAGAVAAAIAAAMILVNKVLNRIEELDQKLTDRTASANELAGRRGEALRLAGVDGADELGARVGALAGNLSSAELTGALETLASEGSGRMTGEQVVSILEKSKRGAAGSALVAGSYGMSSSDALALAERYRLVTRGGTLTKDQGAKIQALLAGGQLSGGVEGVADYLAAAQGSGTNIGAVDAGMPFLNQDPALHKKYLEFRQRASSQQSAVSELEKLRNSALGMAEASLATGDQTRAISSEKRSIDREHAELQTMRDGNFFERTVQATAGKVAMLSQLGVLPYQGRPMQVEVVNLPRQRVDR